MTRSGTPPRRAVPRWLPNRAPFDSAAAFGDAYRIALYIAAFLIPAALARFYVLNHFYRRGGYSWDSGWIAETIGRPSLTLPLGELLDVNHYGTWYAYHFSPILAVVSWVGALLPVSPPRLLALFLGSISGALGLTVYAALARSCGDRGPLRLLALPTAVLAAFGGPALAAIGFPHYETAIPVLILGFLALRALRRPGWAIAAFVACLLVREDSGLHLALLLGTVALIRSVRSGSPRAAIDEWRFAVAALAYVVLATAIQHVWFHGGRLFQIEFLGQPPFAHLTRRRVVDIAHVFFTDRQYIYLPFLVTVVAAAATRSWMLLAGFLASIPWLLVCCAANFDQIADLYAYYGFPFILGSCWPAVSALIDPSAAAPKPSWRPIVIQLVVTVASIVGFLGSGMVPDPRPWTSFRPLPHAISAASTDALVDWIAQAKPGLGRIIAGDGVVALAPGRFTSAEWYKWDDEWSSERFDRADTLVFFRPERLERAAGKFAGGAPEIAIFSGTRSNIVIVTRRPASGIAPPSGLLSRPCTDLPSSISLARSSPPGHSVLTSGWSYPETKGRWSIGGRADLDLQLCRLPETALRVTAEAQGFTIEQHPTEDVDVLANDMPVAHWAFRAGQGGGVPGFLIPLEAFKGGTWLRLSFEIHDPESPAELGVSADDRNLGLYLESLSFQPVQEK